MTLSVKTVQTNMHVEHPHTDNAIYFTLLYLSETSFLLLFWLQSEESVSVSHAAVRWLTSHPN